MSQPLIVFWSWQSDHPSRISKDFVKNAFEAALILKNENLVIDFDARPDTLELDHDTKGLTGPVDIIDVIKKKIDACDHFIADITPVARTDAGKAIPNPNVMIEMGYALRTKSIEQLTFVANSRFFKGVNDIPFDIRTRRAPLTYDLGLNSTNDKLEREVKRFAVALQPAIQSVTPLIATQNLIPADALQPTDKYTFVRNNSTEILGYTRNLERRFMIPKQPFPFIKIAPSNQIRPLLNKELNPDAKGMSMFTGIGNGGDWIREYDGWTTIETFADQPKTPISLTKIFLKSGLVWSVDYSNGRSKDGTRYLGDMLEYPLYDYNAPRFIDITNVPEHWFKYLTKALELYAHLGIEGPYDIQAGMFVRMPLDVQFNHGHMYKITGSSNKILSNQTLSSQTECVDVITDLFETVLDSAAYEYGFLPKHLAHALNVLYEN